MTLKTYADRLTDKARLQSVAAEAETELLLREGEGNEGLRDFARRILKLAQEE